MKKVKKSMEKTQTKICMHECMEKASHLQAKNKRCKNFNRVLAFLFTVWVFIHMNTRGDQNKRKKEKHYKCSLFCCVSVVFCGFAYSRAFLIDEGLGCELGHIKRLVSLQVNCRKCFELKLNHSVVCILTVRTARQCKWKRNISTRREREKKQRFKNHKVQSLSYLFIEIIKTIVAKK